MKITAGNTCFAGTASSISPASAKIGSAIPQDTNSLRDLFDAYMNEKNGDAKNSVLKERGITSAQYDALPQAQRRSITEEIDAVANEAINGDNGMIRGADGKLHFVPETQDDSFLRSIGLIS